jgi:Domain of unknown function (DUF4262)
VVEPDVAAYLRAVRSRIDEHGWALQHIDPTDQSLAFTYTVGLADAGLPELIIIGLPFPVSAGYLNHFAKLSLSSELALGSQYDVQTPSRVVRWLVGAVSPSNASQYLGIAEAIHGAPVVGLQLIWPDADGRLPGDPGYVVSPSQPLLA